jgi:hypothetical protein
MYSLKEFDFLENKYGPYSSWAIWNEKDQKDTSVIRDNIKKLNTKYVFLALNISKPLEKSWSNFHGGKHDRKLIKACLNSDLKGAYITDIFKGIVDPDSSKLKGLPEEIIKNNVNFFNQEMSDINITDETIFIVLGVEGSIISNYFEKYFRIKYKNRFINYYHYSYYGISDKEWVDGLINKLK